jgi:glutamine cyclotransferase
VNGGARPALGRRAFASALVAAAIACAQTGPSPTPAEAQNQALATIYGFVLVNAFPHDPEAFTQGLVFRDGFLYESTGLNGRSSLRKVRLETGEVLQREDVDRRYFAEGLTDWDGRLLQLTWETNVGFIYDLASFKLERTFQYEGEGWGLTHDGTRLIMSDGTPRLRFLDPMTQQETGGVEVKDAGVPVDELNELEFVKGEIYANVWMTDRIAIISPQSGLVTAWLDLAGLRPGPATRGDDVLNGIAYDGARDRLFVTGKLWPRLFEVRIRR